MHFSTNQKLAILVSGHYFHHFDVLICVLLLSERRTTEDCETSNKVLVLLSPISKGASNKVMLLLSPKSKGASFLPFLLLFYCILHLFLFFYLSLS